MQLYVESRKSEKLCKRRRPWYSYKRSLLFFKGKKSTILFTLQKNNNNNNKSGDIENPGWQIYLIVKHANWIYVIRKNSTIYKREKNQINEKN